MQKFIHIKALFFLGIFSMFLLHQVVPHLHLQQEIEHSHKAVAPSDNHSHYHDVPENDNSKKGFLDFLLDLHVHSLVSNEILLIQKSSVKQHKIENDLRTPVSSNYSNLPINYDEAEKVSEYHPPKIYFNPYLSFLDSRGPPSLG